MLTTLIKDCPDIYLAITSTCSGKTDLLSTQNLHIVSWCNNMSYKREKQCQGLQLRLGCLIVQAIMIVSCTELESHLWHESTIQSVFLAYS